MYSNEMESSELHESIIRDNDNETNNAVSTLEDDDIQCGRIFYNKLSRVLKFNCTYCEETYDNINYYCEHLSMHISDEDMIVAASDDVDPDLCCEFEDISQVDYCDSSVQKQIPNVHTMEEEETLGECTDLKETGDCECKVESYEITSADNIVENDLFEYADTDNVDEKDLKGMEEVSTAVTPTGSVADDEMDFECMIAATNIVGNINPGQQPTVEETVQRPQRSRKKGRKVTTVKVIAVKNRIAELYEKIKSEEEKRMGMTPFDVVQSQSNVILAANDISISSEEINQIDNDILEQSDSASAYNNNGTGLSRQIIGETVITLLPPSDKSVATAFPSGNAMPSIMPNKGGSNKASVKAGGVKGKEKICPACGMAFRSSFSLTIHKRTHYLESNSEVKLAHKCSDCDRLFNKISELKVHLERVHYPDGYICRICGKKLSSLTLLEKHMRLVHLNKPFSCQVCQKSFETRTLFEAHVDTHIEGRNHKCDICGRRYGTEQSMRHHMRRHKKQVPQCCVVCGKVTLRITQHMKIHTPRPKRVLSCKVCGKVFNFSSGLSHHFKIMHKMPRPPPKTKKSSTPNIANGRSRRARRSRPVKMAAAEKNSNEMLIQEQDIPLGNSKLDIMQEMIANDDDSQEEILEQHELEIEQEQQHQAAHLLQMDNTDDQHLSHSGGSFMQQKRAQELAHKQQLLHDVNLKEEEAKRVIVELIQNATYTSFLPDNQMTEFEVTAPPIAREETISAVNSIVNDC